MSYELLISLACPLLKQARLRITSSRPMKAQLLSLFLLAAPLVLNLVNSEAASDETEPRTGEAHSAPAKSEDAPARESKEEAGAPAAPRPPAAAAGSSSRPHSKAPTARDCWFM
jgi:hypothetical protein